MKKTIFFLVFVFIVLYLFEVCLSLFIKIEPIYSKKIANNFSIECYNQLNYGLYNNSQFTIKYDLRIDEFFVDRKKEKEKNKKTIFAIGESTLQGFPYEKNLSFPFYIQENLDNRYRVVNLGFSALDSFYVKDTVRKILKYKPAGIIIYLGHNEIYGTLGYSYNNGNLLKSDFYLFIKEFKLFQFLLFLRNVIINKNSEKDNLMEQRFNQKYVLNEEKINKSVKNQFEKNVNEIMKITSKYNIPVIFYKPVSNYIDMPPFADIYKNNIDFKKLIEDKNYYDEIKKTEKSLYIDYIDAYVNKDLKRLIEIKDNDPVPFRAREFVIQDLEKIVTGYKNGYFIDTYKELEKIDPYIFDNRIFVDHLHFNVEGNKFLGYLGAMKIKEIFNEDIDINPEKIEKTNIYEEIEEMKGLMKIASLLKNKIFSNMKVKYKNKFSDMKMINYMKKYKEIYDILLKNLNINEQYIEIYNYFASKNMIDEAIVYFDNVRYNDRLNPLLHNILWKLYSIKNNEERYSKHFVMYMKFYKGKDRKDILKKYNLNDRTIDKMFEQIDPEYY